MTRTHVLLVEDDPGHQELLRSALCARSGVQVVVAGTGDRAVQSVCDQGTNYYDCIILDYQLPDSDAPDVLRRLVDAGVNCPILIISSNDDQDIVIRSLRSGVVDFIPKTDAMRSERLWPRIDLALRQSRTKEVRRRRIVRRVQRLAHLAIHDPLTGLLNRRSIDRRFQRRRRSPDRRGAIAVIVIDIDHFKKVNDNYSHDAGDCVLRSLARVLRSATPEKDIACRYGGEEFVIICFQTSLAKAMAWAEATRARIEQTVVELPEGGVIQVTASMGVACGPGDAFWHETFEHADRAVYAAKKLGRNRVCSTQWVPLLDALANQTAAGVHPPRRRFAALLDHYEEAVDTQHAVQLRPHLESVSYIAAACAEALGQPPAIVQRLRDAGLCHDLGKLLIPFQLLAKPGPLTWEEKRLFRIEQGQGAKIAEMLGFNREVIECVRWYNTWIASAGDSDRRSLPKSLCTRILAVADAVAAMTTSRPHAPAASISSAICELRRQAPQPFDSTVLDIVPKAMLHSEVLP
jgi:diguanylate cyclase (GGDEF)-like protein